MSAVTCFWIQPVDFVKRSLRRFSFSDRSRPGLPPIGSCPSTSYHDATIPFDIAPLPHGRIPVTDDGHDVVPHDDPRWPTKCTECGRAFGGDAGAEPFQLFVERLFERPDTGERFTLRDAPPGAMFDDDTHHENWTGPDGLSLTVKLPSGGPFDWWCVDGPSKDGGRWTRTGAIPKVTANPSILTPRYHGWLRDGMLVLA